MISKLYHKVNSYSIKSLGKRMKTLLENGEGGDLQIQEEKSGNG